MIEKQISEIISNVSSDDSALQIEGLDKALIFLDDFFDKIVSTLPHSDNKLFVAERLHAVNLIMEQKIIRLFENAPDEETKFYTALILANGKQTVESIKSYLIKILQGSDWEKISLAVLKLSQSNTKEAIPFFIDLLNKLDVIEADRIIMVLTHLKKLNAVLPQAVIEKLSKPDIAWQIKSVIKEFDK